MTQVDSGPTGLVSGLRGVGKGSDRGVVAEQLKPSTIEVFSAASTGAWNQSVRSKSSANDTVGACGGTGRMPRNSTAHSGWLTKWRVSPPTVIPGMADSRSQASATPGTDTSPTSASVARSKASRSRVPVKVSGMQPRIGRAPDAFVLVR